ncbi:MAG: T9SS type A sorting domain-containing protein [bacterium]|nr:T9SS type A sorting domain-containing protein [bacterium]
MKKHLFGAALILGLLVGGAAVAQTIDDIQVYNPTTGAAASPYVGQIVTVDGIVVERLNYSTGSGYIWKAGDGGVSVFGSGGDSPVYGDYVEVTGTVGAFSGEIQLGTPTWSVLSSGNVPVPVDMTITQILSDYENVGTFGRSIGVVVSKNTAAFNKFFFMTDGTDTIQVFIDGTTGIDITAVDIGDTYQVTAPIVKFNAEIELKPVLQSLLVENPLGDTIPVVTEVNCDNWAPISSTPVTVSASITDNNGVASATLYYRDSDGTSPGAWQMAAMSNVGGDTYEATIPAPHAQSQVDFYVHATDTAAQPATYPGNAPTGFVSLAIGFTSIYAMQTVHPDSASQNNNFVNKILNIKGVVTAAGAAQLGAASKLIVQEPLKNPATKSYAFGGVLVYESNGLYQYFPGDSVEIGGHGEEYFGLTEMIPHSPEAIRLVGFGQTLPPASRVRGNVLEDDRPISDGDGASGEAWESVWVQTWNAAVVDTTGLAQYREWLISDSGSPSDTLMVDTYAPLAYVPTVGDVVTITGFMDYEFGTFKIRPFDDSYVTLTGLTAVDPNVPTIEKAGGFRSIHPNPFNPSTKISFVINKSDLVQLNVYNIRGEKVRTLVQDNLPATEYTLTWDGTDDGGKSVASGSYFARLRIGKEVMQVRQMQLVK